MSINADVVTEPVGGTGVSSQPKVSVVIPMYNVKDYLPKCIESVIRQTLKDIEIICVNDGSTDNSLEIAKEFEAKDPRVKVIDKKNSGYGNSMNIGFNAAKGEYIGIVESDDFIAEDMYEKLYELTLNGTVDVVKSNFYEFYVEENKPPRIEINRERDMIPDSEKPFTLTDNAQISWGHPSVWTAIYRREFITANGIKFVEAKGGGWVDNPFFYETLAKAKSIMWTKKPYYYYMKSNPNSSSNLQMDPRLPFDRMMDNLDVLERNNIKDEPNKRCAYARALMYLNGAVHDFDYDRHFEVINSCARALMRRLDENTLTSSFNLRDQNMYYTYASPLNGMIAKGPKVLIYNWLPFDNPWGWGGGVTVYCKNVITEILRNDPSVNIYFLSSGFAYSATTDKTFFRKINNMFGDRVHQYEIVNSPVPADQRNIYINPNIALEDESLKNVFADFMNKYGPFSAVHFNNIEGLSLDVFDLKKDFPDTKFIYSIHNYVPMCATGIYYMRHKHCNCTPDRTCQDCWECTRTDIKTHVADETYDRALFGNDPKKCISKKRWLKAFDFERLDKPVEVDHIQDFAKTATEKINKNCDSILAVSKRVYDIAAENGFDESKMIVQYIGTKVADRQIGHAAAKAENGLKIVFLGSDINYEEKGYAFLLDTLEKMDPKYSSKIDLVLTVKQAEHAEIYTMLRNFRSLKVIQGYTHDDLEWIFEGANLSLVPVLWEDNLPQIAIESVAYGVPVLASTAGGAKELCDSDLFRFECADSDDMLAKIMHFVDYPEDLQEYWKHHHGLVTMKQHWSELSKLYGISDDMKYEISRKEFNYLLKENFFLHENISLNDAKITPSPVVEGLRQKLREVNERNTKLEEEIKEMKRYSGKCIFLCDHDPVQGPIGTTMFKITVDDFEFSDFFAEIRFIRLNNLTYSSSDILKISGTLAKDGERGELKLHQIDWSGDNADISDNIYYYINGNEIFFFCTYTERFAGFAWDVESIASRAAYDSARYTKIAPTMISDPEALPKKAFNSMGMMIDNLL